LYYPNTGRKLESTSAVKRTAQSCV